MPVSRKGPWSDQKIEQFLLERNIPLRLACTGADDFPRVVSVWFVFDQGRFLCVSHQGSQLVSLLRGNTKVGFEVAPDQPPYCGVRGQGIATLSHQGAEEVLQRVLQRYLGGSDSGLARWLLSRRDEEVLITIEPRRLFSWDYRERMRDD